jgi:hypothetical protein
VRLIRFRGHLPKGEYNIPNGSHDEKPATAPGLDFFRRLVALEQRHGRDGQRVGHSIQTNSVLLDAEWCVYGAKTWSRRQDVLMNHSTETIATLDTSFTCHRHGRWACRVRRR